MSRLAGRILDEIIEPLREVQIDDTELACIKTIVFFDPGLLIFKLIRFRMNCNLWLAFSIVLKRL